jgi:hypothetical protein
MDRSRAASFEGSALIRMADFVPKTSTLLTPEMMLSR